MVRLISISNTEARKHGDHVEAKLILFKNKQTLVKSKLTVNKLKNLQNRNFGGEFIVFLYVSVPLC